MVYVIPAAIDEFDALQPRERAVVLNALDRLAAWPKVSGVKMLKGLDQGGTHRVRAGKSRIVFNVEDGAIYVQRIRHRQDAYLVRKAHRQAKS